MSAALAYKISDIESDPSLMATATKECYDCDPDNPRAVTTDKCPSCRGTRRQLLAAVEIAEDLKATKAGTGNGDEVDADRFDENDELYLDY